MSEVQKGIPSAMEAELRLRQESLPNSSHNATAPSALEIGGTPVRPEVVLIDNWNEQIR